MRYATLLEALANIRDDQKITYGTRDKHFHLIERDDRDFFTAFAYTRDRAEQAGEKAIIAAMITTILNGVLF